ncbi:MAG: TIGR00725 family protein, partial [Desulfuromonadales bacterium]|nr:TIGR00725 family protein [Desulfuromonadales bacterium]
MSNKRKPIIGVIGASQPSSDGLRMAEEVGREIALRGAMLVCGGLGGVMEAAAKGA